LTMNQDRQNNFQVNGSKIAVMQPYLFPYIGYYQLIKAVDIFVVYDDVNYINKGWINRNRILLNGKERLFALPLEKASQNKLINKIDIFEPAASKNVLWGLISQAYKNMPGYNNLHSTLEEIILFWEKNLSEYLIYSLKKLSEYLGMKTRFILSSEIEKDNKMKGSGKILEICKKMGANTYINPIGGTELYNKDEFEAAGIKLWFIKTLDIKYSQLKDPFVPNLSIIDVLMFNPRDQVSRYLDAYELV